MRKTFQELISYLKSPEYKVDSNTNFNYRIQKFLHLLIICVLSGIVITPLFALIEELGLVNMDNHSIEDMIKNYSKTFIFFAAVIAAPLIEELIFRGPLMFFKNNKNFKLLFYTIAILSGFIHISNFTITQNVLLLSPILVAPQILLGGYLGFIRVRFGLVWSIALHASYYGIIMLLSFSSELF